MYVERHKENLG